MHIKYAEVWILLLPILNSQEPHLYKKKKYVQKDCFLFSFIQIFFDLNQTTAHLIHRNY